MQLSAVILAGGKSSRMGQDKALLPFGGYNSLAEYQYQKLKKIFNSVYISTKDNKFDFDAKLIYDKYQDSSPLVAIVSIFEELNCDAFLLLSVDIPFVDLKDIEKLIQSYNQNSDYDVYVIKSGNGIEPTAAIYSKTILKNAKKMLDANNHKLTELILQNNYKLIKCDNKENFININTKNDYLKSLNKKY